MAGEKGHFFQLPLAILRHGPDVLTRLNDAIAWACVDVGLKSMRENEDISAKQAPKDFNESDTDHIAAVVGARTIGVIDYSCKKFVASWKRIEQFLEPLAGPKGHLSFRLHSHLVFEARDGTGLSYREFSVYAALRASVGTEPIKWVTRNALVWLSMGYNRSEAMEADVSLRPDGAKPLTVRQIGITLDELVERSLIPARVRANKRETYYSFTLSPNDVAKKLAEIKSQRAQRRQQEAALTEQINTAVKTASCPHPAPSRATPEGTPRTPGSKQELPGSPLPAHKPDNEFDDLDDDETWQSVMAKREGVTLEAWMAQHHGTLKS